MPTWLHNLITVLIPGAILGLYNVVSGVDVTHLGLPAWEIPVFVFAQQMIDDELKKLMAQNPKPPTP